MESIKVIFFAALYLSQGGSKIGFESRNVYFYVLFPHESFELCVANDICVSLSPCHTDALQA